MQRRRVVTANAPDGTAVVAVDEEVAPITVALIPGGEFHPIWGADEPVVLPVDGAQLRRDGWFLPPSGRFPAPRGWFPPPRGFRFGFVTIPPVPRSSHDELDLEAAIAELREKLPGMVDVLEPDHPGTHTTDTVDFAVILSGEVWLELDNDAQVELHAGDCVVQNGTRHAWHNRSHEPCVMAVALVGSGRAGG